MIKCPHCSRQVFQLNSQGDKIKVRTRILVLHKTGEAEINCPHCRNAITVGRIEQPRLEKAFQRPRFIIPQKKT